MNAQPLSMPPFQLRDQMLSHPGHVLFRVADKHVEVKVVSALPPLRAPALRSERLVKDQTNVPSVPEQHRHHHAAADDEDDDDDDEDVNFARQEAGLLGHVESGQGWGAGVPLASVVTLGVMEQPRGRRSAMIC